MITPTVEICIHQLGRVEKNNLITIRCYTEYLARAEPLRRAGLSAAAETFVEISCGKTDTQTNRCINPTPANAVGVGNNLLVNKCGE